MVAKKICKILPVSILVIIMSINYLYVPVLGIDEKPVSPNSITDFLDIEQSADGEQTYTKTAVRGNRALYVDLATGQFYLRDNKNNVSWSSVPDNLDEVSGMKGATKNRVRSNLILEILDTELNNNSVSAYSQSDSVNNDAVESKLIENGVRVEYTFPDYGITVPLILELTENGFITRIETGDIVEMNSKYQLASISMLPYFNAGYYDENGFLFVPDGSGALIYFNNGESDMAGYEQSVYGIDHGLSLNFYNNVEQEVRLPIYGAAHEKQYSLAVITKGAAGAKILASGNISTNKYNYVYALFPLRLKDYFQNEGKWSDVSLYQKNKLPDRVLEIEFILKSAISPTYVELATTFREYLTSTLGIKPISNQSSLEVDFVGATIQKKLFLGIPMNSTVSLTNFSQAKKVLDAFYTADIGNVTVRYLKWSTTTAWQKMKASKSGLSLLGGNNAFEILMDTIKDYGYKIYLDTNPVQVYKGNSLLSYFTDYSHSIFDSSIKLYKYTLNTYTENDKSRISYLVKKSLLGNQFSSWDKTIAKLNVTGISLSGTGTLYTDFRQTDACMEDTKNLMIEAIKGVVNNDNVMVQGGNMYTLPYADYLSGVPGSASGFDVEDESVPFYQIALHGIIPYSSEPINAQSNYTEAYLHAVETGSILRFQWIGAKGDDLEFTDAAELYYANYEQWLPLAINMVRQCENLYQKTAASTITKHTSLTAGVYMTVYENGIFTIVNYNIEEVSTDYGTVKSKSFLIGENNN